MKEIVTVVSLSIPVPVMHKGGAGEQKSGSCLANWSSKVTNRSQQIEK